MSMNNSMRGLQGLQAFALGRGIAWFAEHFHKTVKVVGGWGAGAIPIPLPLSLKSLNPPVYIYSTNIVACNYQDVTTQSVVMLCVATIGNKLVYLLQLLARLVKVICQILN